MVIEALIGSLHQDQRLRHWLPSEYFENSSWMPFGAMLSGKQSLIKAMDEIGYKTLAVSIILCLITIWYCNREIDD